MTGRVSAFSALGVAVLVASVPWMIGLSDLSSTDSPRLALVAPLALAATGLRP